jgi:endonuclease VIII
VQRVGNQSSCIGVPVPEGPSIVILKEEIAPFAGRKIVKACSSTALDLSRVIGQRVIEFHSWGKHFLIELPEVTIRIHFLLFGSYLINDAKPVAPRLGLRFARGEINFYACSVQFLDDELDQLYDWRGDVMSDAWDAALARKKLRSMPEALVCDALLDQRVFAGVGNIIKNEVLFRIRLHPLSTVGSLPSRKLRELVDQARTYSFEFLEWKKAGVLKRHWLAHTKKTCPRCKSPFTLAELGKTHRRSFFCENCQVLYAPARKRRARRR